MLYKEGGGDCNYILKESRKKKKKGASTIIGFVQCFPFRGEEMLMAPPKHKSFSDNDARRSLMTASDGPTIPSFDLGSGEGEGAQCPSRPHSAQRPSSVKPVWLGGQPPPDNVQDRDGGEGPVQILGTGRYLDYRSLAHQMAP